MKKISIILATAFLAMSCASSSKLSTTSTFTRPTVGFTTTKTIADVKVSETKVSYDYVLKKAAKSSSLEVILRMAVREAIHSAGDQYDVLMAMETLVRYTSKGEIESVNVTGYPGTYVNWRSSDELAAPEDSQSLKTNTLKMLGSIIPL